MQKVMDVLGISFMIIFCFFTFLHLWFATLAVSGLRNIYEIFWKYLRNIYEIFMFLVFTLCMSVVYVFFFVCSLIC